MKLHAPDGQPSAWAESTLAGPRRWLAPVLRFIRKTLIIATLVKARERFMGIGQVLTMPLFFASNAIYPVAMMPPWLQVLAHLNPLTYEVDALRALMLAQGTTSYGLAVDFAVLVAATAALVGLGSRLYPRVAT